MPWIYHYSDHDNQLRKYGVLFNIDQLAHKRLEPMLLRETPEADVKCLGVQ